MSAIPPTEPLVTPNKDDSTHYKEKLGYSYHGFEADYKTRCLQDCQRSAEEDIWTASLGTPGLTIVDRDRFHLQPLIYQLYI